MLNNMKIANTILLLLCVSSLSSFAGGGGLVAPLSSAVGGTNGSGGGTNTYTAGTGIAINGSVISVTNPPIGTITITNLGSTIIEQWTNSTASSGPWSNSWFNGFMIQSGVAKNDGTSQTNSAYWRGDTNAVLIPFLSVGGYTNVVGNTPLVNNSVQTICSFTLPPGHYNMSGYARLSGAFTTLTTSSIGISTTSASFAGAVQTNICGLTTSLSSFQNTLVLPIVTSDIAISTTYYLVGSTAESVSTAAWDGQVTIWRRW